MSAHGGPNDLRIDLLHAMDEARAAAELWREVWGGDEYPVQSALVVAQAHAGGYASGAWRGDRLVGASLGLLGPPDAPVLHSHITGVVSDASGLGIGRALKRHQAAWCREHGITAVTWTFDPLVARNAWFNLGRLGVRVEAYAVDYYGDMPDDRNRGQGSDRLLVSWDVSTDEPGEPPSGDHAAPSTATPPTRVVDVGPDNEPVTHAATGTDVLVAVPSDVEAIRRRDPDLAIRWRHAVREAMVPRLAPNPDGGGPAWSVTGFTRDGGYRLRRHPDPTSDPENP